jgi:hypothetical protein
VADPIGPMIHVVDFFDSFLNFWGTEHEVEDTSFELFLMKVTILPARPVRPHAATTEPRLRGTHQQNKTFRTERTIPPNECKNIEKGQTFAG